MIKALKDTMVFPNEGEWWGHFADGSLKTVLPMNETVWYKNDTFGLRTADEAGKIVFNTTAGDHLQVLAPNDLLSRLCSCPRCAPPCAETHAVSSLRAVHPGGTHVVGRKLLCRVTCCSNVCFFY